MVLYQFKIGGLAMDDILSMIMEFEKQGYTKEQIEAITGYKLEELNNG